MCAKCAPEVARDCRFPARLSAGTHPVAVEAVDIAALAASLGVCHADITVLGNQLPRAICQWHASGDRQIIRIHPQFVMRARF